MFNDSFIKREINFIDVMTTDKKAVQLKSRVKVENMTKLFDCTKCASYYNINMKAKR